MIDASQRWSLTGTANADQLLPLARQRGPLWIDGHHTGQGHNDKIPEGAADALASSLLLVAANDVTVRVIGKHTDYGEKTQTRLRFTLGAASYDLSVTDPVAHEKYANPPRGEHQLEHPLLLCVSLSEPSYGYRYKLAAGVVELAG